MVILSDVSAMPPPMAPPPPAPPPPLQRAQNAGRLPDRGARYGVQQRQTRSVAEKGPPSSSPTGNGRRGGRARAAARVHRPAAASRPPRCSCISACPVMQVRLLKPLPGVAHYARPPAAAADDAIERHALPSSGPSARLLGWEVQIGLAWARPSTWRDYVSHPRDGCVPTWRANATAQVPLRQGRGVSDVLGRGALDLGRRLDVVETSRNVRRQGRSPTRRTSRSARDVRGPPSPRPTPTTRRG